MSWKAVTTGNTCGIDLWLEEAASGEISIETAHVSASLKIGDIGIMDTVFEAGGLDRALKLYRLPDAPHEFHLTHRMSVPVAESGDTPVFVRVTQVDGHKAWSSPVYLYR